jgi:dTDP-4-dehydrorhamnose reductase
VRVVVTGARGQLGSELVAAGAEACEADVTEPFTIEGNVDAVIHCAAMTDVDGCETQVERAMQVNEQGVRNVLAASDAFTIVISTDYVFDGCKPMSMPYVESDAPYPLSTYGRSKLAGEKAVDLARHAVVRVSWVCGQYGKGNLVKTVLRLLEGDAPLRFATDTRSRPTFTSDLAPWLMQFAEKPRPGIWHVTNQGAVSAYEFAQEIARAGGHDPSRIEPTTVAELPERPAARPANAVLASERLRDDELLPHFGDALAQLVTNLRR